MENLIERIIHLVWEGPKLLDEIKELDNEKEDFGVYQVYGNHPVYGMNSLIYIGMSAQQTFAVRIRQQFDSWLNDKDLHPLRIYIGRIDTEDELSDQEWQKLYEQAERMLIYAHAPSYNSSKIGKPLGKEYKKIHILNWGIRGNLLPEVSGVRWSDVWD